MHPSANALPPRRHVNPVQDVDHGMEKRCTQRDEQLKVKHFKSQEAKWKKRADIKLEVNCYNQMPGEGKIYQVCPDLESSIILHKHFTKENNKQG